MSADNGIYILESKDGFRVVHTQAIDNLWWWDDICATTNEINPKYLIRYFEKCDVYKTSEEAMAEAKRMYDEIMQSDFPILEYGISFISGWEDKPFPETL
jgi:hypothetical protein